MLVSGGLVRNSIKVNRNVGRFDPSNSQFYKNVSRMNKGRFFSQAVFVKGEIFVFGGYHKYTCFVNSIPLNMIKSVEKYSPVTKTWSTVASMRDDHKNYSACAFMDSIYIIGGNNGFSNSCFKFNTKDYQLK